MPQGAVLDFSTWSKVRITRTRAMAAAESSVDLDRLHAVLLVEAGEAWIDDLTIEVPAEP